MFQFDDRGGNSAWGWYANGNCAILWRAANGNAILTNWGQMYPSSDNSWWCGVTGGSAWYACCAYNYPGGSGRSQKKDIATFEPADALDKVMALRAVNFRWREVPDVHDALPRDNTRLHSGFIADEVASVMGKDWGGYFNVNGGEAVDRTQLVGVLWAAVQQLANEVAGLKARLP